MGVVGIAPMCVANDLSAVHFQRESLSLPEGTYFDSQVIDLNGDGKMDLAVLNDGALYVLLGDGSGNFSLPVPYNQTGFQTVVAFGDFDGDGFPDAAVANFPGINILLNNGAGGFPTSVFINTGAEPSGLAIADFNLDGNLDLAVSDFQANWIPFSSEMAMAGSFLQSLSQPVSAPAVLLRPISIMTEWQIWPPPNMAPWISGFSKA